MRLQIIFQLVLFAFLTGCIPTSGSQSETDDLYFTSKDKDLSMKSDEEKDINISVEENLAGLDKTTVYNRSLYFMESYFPEDTFIVENGVDHILVKNPVFIDAFKMDDGFIKDLYVAYRIKISSFDNRYKYEFTDVWVKPVYETDAKYLPFKAYYKNLSSKEEKRNFESMIRKNLEKTVGKLEETMKYGTYPR